jgi:hypothetical protein
MIVLISIKQQMFEEIKIEWWNELFQKPCIIPRFQLLAAVETYLPPIRR